MVFNNIDYFILVVSLFSIFHSIKNGFIRELLWFIAFALSLGIIYVFGNQIEQKVMSLIGIKFLSIIVSYAIGFVILFSLFYYILSSILPDRMIKTVTDRMLGAIFGAFKFFCLLLFFCYFINLLFPLQSQPPILKESVLKNIADYILNSGVLRYIQMLFTN